MFVLRKKRLQVRFMPTMAIGDQPQWHQDSQLFMYPHTRRLSGQIRLVFIATIYFEFFSYCLNTRAMLAFIYLLRRSSFMGGFCYSRMHAAFCLHPDPSSSHTYAGTAGLKSLSKHFLTTYKIQTEAMP